MRHLAAIYSQCVGVDPDSILFFYPDSMGRTSETITAGRVMASQLQCLHPKLLPVMSEWTLESSQLQEAFRIGSIQCSTWFRCSAYLKVRLHEGIIGLAIVP